MNSEYLSDHVFSVSELCLVIKNTVSEMFFGLQVEGEVCNFRSNQSRHWYFSLKDKDGSLINCTCFAGNNWKERKPENGEVVVLRGSLSFWPKGGSLSFNAETIRLKGEGDLRLEIEKRRAYYKSLGYFDDEAKKKLPERILTIGIVTSAEGAVIHDIMNVTRRRAPSINLLLFPSLVQGKGAEESIARRIRQANNFAACDVLIVARGGGSEEDLAAYSSVEVIEAIHDSMIPVISAVGHDSDFPLSDFVADLRAPTPSAAAELVTESAYKKRLEIISMEKELLESVKGILRAKKMALMSVRISDSLITRKLENLKSVLREAESFKRIVKTRLSSASFEKAGLDEKIEHLIREKDREASFAISDSWRAINETILAIRREKAEIIKSDSDEIKRLVTERLRDKKSRLSLLSNSMEDLNPLSILKRGYSIVRTEEGKIIKRKSDVSAGERYTLTLSDGDVMIRVEDKI